MVKKIKKPVVLQVLPEMNHGGVEMGTVEVASGMQAVGIKNFVASAGGRMVYELNKLKVQHWVLVTDLKYLVRDLKKFKSFFFYIHDIIKMRRLI